MLWLTLGIISFGLYKNHIYDHYYGFILPSVFLLAAILIYQAKILGLIFLLFISYLSFIQNPLIFAPNNQLGVTQQIVESITQDSNKKEFNFALMSKMNYADPYLYFFENSNLFDNHNKITDQLYVVCEPFQMECAPINNSLWSIASFGWAKIDKQWQINDIKIFRLIKNPNGTKE